MIRLHRMAVAVAALLAAGAVPLRAQSLSSGSVEGVVVGEAGEPVPGATLTLRNEASGFARSVTTDREGRYALVVLPAGEYSLRAEQFGFRPRLVRGVVVRPGKRVTLPVTLPAVAQAAERVDTVVLPNARLAAQGQGLVEDVGRGRVERYPHERREVTELGRFSTRGDAELAMQGLPAALSGVRVDGMPVGALESPSLVPGSLRAAAFPLGMAERAALVATNPDVEWSGVAGGTLDAYTRRAGGPLAGSAFGLWSGEALRTGASGGETGQSVQGGFQVGGSLVPDTVSLLLGVEAWRLAPLGQAWALDPSAQQALEVARTTYGLDPAAPAPASDVVTAFGQLAWQLSAATHLDARANAALLPAAAGDLRRPPLAGRAHPFDGRDLSAGATLTTRFGDRMYQEVRLGVDAGARSYGDPEAGALLGSTRVLSAGVALGVEGDAPASFEQTTLRASETLFLRAGDHRLKFGLSAALDRYELGTRARESFLFSDPEAFAAGRGLLVRAEPAVGAGPGYSLPRGALFAQDTWTVGTGLDLLLGVRLDVERLPRDRVDASEPLRALTGLDNTDAPSTWWRLSPRVGFTWDVQERHEWVLGGSAGVYSGSTDPVLIGDWIRGAGQTRFRRGFATLEGWPAAPGEEVVPATGPALALLDPGYEAPRTLRGHLELSRALGAATVLRLSGLVRRTDFLPRFRDLNLLPEPAARDQFGRAVFGTLRQEGGLVFAEPGSNRRFDAFDRVVAAGVDGWSTYRALSVELERRPSAGLGLFAGYTHSRTRDSWVPGSASALELPLPPFPDAPEDDWMEGRSDLDAPHRAVAGASWSSPALLGLEAAVLYRYSSGAPFTPGFRDGVDANGDGSFLNDPAFVDPALEGMDALLDAWPCLRDQAGAFAERNACRGAGLHSLDARLAFGVARLGRYAAELVVDGLNLLGSEIEVPDTALYLLDPGGALAMDPSTGRVTLPLVVNGNFGRPLALLQPGRVIRVGFRVNH